MLGAALLHKLGQTSIIKHEKFDHFQA